jgi:hypothetical protein
VDRINGRRRLVPFPLLVQAGFGNFTWPTSAIMLAEVKPLIVNNAVPNQRLRTTWRDESTLVVVLFRLSCI